MNLPQNMNEDRTVSDRPIRAVRTENGADFGRIWVEEQYKAGEIYAFNVDRATFSEVSTEDTWRWRMVFNGKPADYQIALHEWMQRWRSGLYASIR